MQFGIKEHQKVNKFTTYIFRRENISTLSEAVEKYTSHRSERRVKPGFKIGLFYLTKVPTKLVKASFLIKDNENDAKSIDNFLWDFELLKDIIFSDVLEQVNPDRKIKIQKARFSAIGSQCLKIKGIYHDKNTNI